MWKDDSTAHDHWGKLVRQHLPHPPPMKYESLEKHTGPTSTRHRECRHSSSETERSVTGKC